MCWEVVVSLAAVGFGAVLVVASVMGLMVVGAAVVVVTF